MKLKKINRTSDNFKGYYFYSYYSKFRFGDGQDGKINIGEYHFRNRNHIYSLKDGFYNNSLKLASVIDRFVRSVKETLGDNIFENKIILTIPASSSDRTILRWRSFCKQLCSKTGAENGFSYIVNNQRPVLPNNKFKVVGDVQNKNLIVIDDVYTNGNTSKLIYDMLIQRGPRSILFLFFGETKRNYPFNNLTELEIYERSQFHLVKLKDAIKNGEDISSFDTSCITDMSNLFKGKIVKDNISQWDVRNVRYMNSMFENCSIKSSISKWNVSQVVNMSKMFKNTNFTGDISNWDISSVEDMDNMFFNSSFNGDLSKWDLANCKNQLDMHRFKTKNSS